MLSPGEDDPDPQLLVPVTVIEPEDASGANLTVIVLVLAPEVIVAPNGNTQLYPVAKGMVETV